jgi:hypothetical protein
MTWINAMNWVNGVQEPVPLWQYAYMVPLIMSICLLLCAHVCDDFRGNGVGIRSLFITIPAACGIGLMLGFPTNLIVLWSALVLMHGLGAPLGSTIFAGALVVACWAVCFWTVFGRCVSGRKTA